MTKKQVILLWSILIFFVVAISGYAQQTNLFTVFGETLPNENTVTVKNLTTKDIVSGTVGAFDDPGKYTATFMDLSNNRPASVGDQLEITVKNPEDEVIFTRSPYTVTAQDISDKKVRIDINVGEITLMDSAPLRWSYTLKWKLGSITQWSYTGAAITGAYVDGDATAAGWSVQTQTDTKVVFSSTTPLTESELTGFHITGTAGGIGSWTAGDNSGSAEGSVPVELSSFTATRTQNGVLIRWHTETEINNLGFDVYRITGEKIVKVNVKIIQGHGTTGTPSDYQFVDTDAPKGVVVRYFIEQIDFVGNRKSSKIIVPLSPHDKLPMTWGEIKTRR